MNDEVRTREQLLRELTELHRRIAELEEILVSGGSKWHRNPLPGGAETILVVEEEANVREWVVQTLKQLGYQVLQAEGGIAALRMCRARLRPIDLVLTDVVLPEMSGREFVVMLRQWRSDFRVLFVSDELVGDHGELEPGVHLIQKPSDPAQLALKVRRVLDEAIAVPADSFFHLARASVYAS